MNLYIINVGVNKTEADKYGIKSPIFEDGTFEFVPIKEARKNIKFSEYKYSDLLCFYDHKKKISDYLPAKYSNYWTHNDPDFNNLTYGDVDSSRASNLQYISKNDKVLFLARLYDYKNSQFCGNGAQYFIALFTIREIIFSFGGSPFTKKSQDRYPQISNNAHYIRFIKGRVENSTILIGSEDSFRFRKAIRIDSRVASLVFNADYEPLTDRFRSKEDNKIVNNKNGKPRSLKQFHSITRVIQPFLSDAIVTEKKSLKDLIKIIDSKCW